MQLAKDFLSFVLCRPGGVVAVVSTMIGPMAGEGRRRQARQQRESEGNREKSAEKSQEKRPPTKTFGEEIPVRQIATTSSSSRDSSLAKGKEGRISVEQKPTPSKTNDMKERSADQKQSGGIRDTSDKVEPQESDAELEGDVLHRTATLIASKPRQMASVLAYYRCIAPQARLCG